MKKNDYNGKASVHIVLSTTTIDRLVDIARAEGIYSPKTGKPSLSQVIETLVARYTTSEA